jgi:hypothetical protein
MAESGDVNKFRMEVADCDKEAQGIKAVLRGLGPQSEDEENNILAVKLVQVSRMAMRAI